MSKSNSSAQSEFGSNYRRRHCGSGSGAARGCARVTAADQPWRQRQAAKPVFRVARPAMSPVPMYYTESVRALIASVPLPMQHEDRGHQAAASLTPVPGSRPVLGDRPLLGGCSWAGSSHAPASHPASLLAPCPPDFGSHARSSLSLSSSP